MNLKELLGDTYRAEMTKEEQLEALLKLDLVDRAKLPATVGKETFDKTASELADYKRQLRELQEQSMSAEEKQTAALQAAEETKRKYEQMMLKVQAQQKLVQAGVTDAELVETLFGNAQFTSEKAMNAVLDTFLNAREQVKKETEKRVKAEIYQNAPTPPKGTEETPSVSWEKMSVTERMQAKAKNPEIFSN